MATCAGVSATSETGHTLVAAADSLQSGLTYVFTLSARVLNRIATDSVEVEVVQGSVPAVSIGLSSYSTNSNDRLVLSGVATASSASLLTYLWSSIPATATSTDQCAIAPRRTTPMCSCAAQPTALVAERGPRLQLHVAGIWRQPLYLLDLRGTLASTY